MRKVRRTDPAHGNTRTAVVVDVVSVAVAAGEGVDKEVRLSMNIVCLISSISTAKDKNISTTGMTKLFFFSLHSRL